MNDNNKLMILGAVVAGYFLMTKGQYTATGCKKFIVNSEGICDTDLNDLNYIYWANRSTGPDGWYHLDSFANVFNIAPAQFKAAFQTAAEATKDPQDPAFTVAQKTFNDYLIAGEAPLTLA